MINKLPLSLFLIFFITIGSFAQQEKESISLFNGVDLSGWNIMELRNVM